MLKRRRTKKISKAEARKMKAGTQILTCKVCGITRVKTNTDTVAITCAICVSTMVAEPEQPKYLTKTSGKPRGWHFKNYFEYEGKVYSRGVEITKQSDIKKLREEGNPTKKSSATKKTTKRKTNGNNSSKKPRRTKTIS
jgi:hypothetical protein